MLTVVFALWSDPKQRWREAYGYSMEHVDRAARMVRRNLQIPHRFLLLTDDQFHNVPTILDAGDAWQIDYLDEKLLMLGHRWPKLSLFSPVAKEYGDQLLYLDLDMVITGPLDSLVTDDDFRIVQQTVPLKGMHYNSSIMLLRPGTRDRVWNEFDPDKAMRLCRENQYGASDQYWIANVLGGDERTWSPVDGVYQFRDVMTCVDDKKLPHNARIVIFPGPYDPSMPTLQRGYPWIKEHWH